MLLVGGQNDSADGERGFEQHLYGVAALAGTLDQLFEGEPSVAVAEHVQDAPLDHDAGGLEYDGAESYPLRHPLGFTGGEGVVEVCFF